MENLEITIEVRRYMAENGRKGGKARAKKDKAELTRIGALGAKARWAKKPAK